MNRGLEDGLGYKVFLCRPEDQSSDLITCTKPEGRAAHFNSRSWEGNRDRILGTDWLARLAQSSSSRFIEISDLSKKRERDKGRLST